MKMKRFLVMLLAVALAATAAIAVVGCGETPTDGLSAYELAVKNGFTGTEAEWLDSLKGEKGKPGTNGSAGTSGAAGKSAYEIAVEGGYKGTEAEWIASLKGVTGKPGVAGKSAYEIAKENGFTGTEAEWLESLKGEVGETGADGTDGVLSITSAQYVTADKWGIRHKLQLSYIDANDEPGTITTEQSVDIVDQNVFYEAADSDELWQLMELHVRRIRLVADVLWAGNRFVDHSSDKTPVAKYTSVIELTEDVEIDFAGHEVILEADALNISGNASVTLKNGSLKRINRAVTSDSAKVGTVEDQTLNGVEHAGRTVYVSDTYPDGKPVASDKELKRTQEYARLANTEGEAKVVATDGTSGAASNATVHIANYCSLKLDTIDFFTFFTGVLVDGLSSSVEVINNSTVDAEGTYGIATNALSAERWNVVIQVRNSVINASSVNERRNTIPGTFVPATALMINVPGSVIVENSDLIGTSQSIIVRGGHFVARNSRLSSLGVFPYQENRYDNSWGSSNDVPSATVVVGNKGNGYQYFSDCTLTNCELKANTFPNGLFKLNWETVWVNGNSGVNNTGYNADGEWIGAAFTYDAMTFARSGDVNFHVENKDKTTGRVYRPEMLLNANEWYEAESQRKISDLMDYGAKNIRLTTDLLLEANVTEGENAGYTVIDRDLQFGLNGHTLTIDSKGIKVTNNADVLFQNGRIIMNKTEKPTADMIYGDYAMSVGEFCTLSLEAVKMYTNRSAIFMDGKAATLNVAADSEINAGGFYGIGTNVSGSTDFGVIITIKYSKIIAGVGNEFATANPQDADNKYGVGVLINVPATLKVEKASYIAGQTQGIILRNGIAIIENSTVEALGTNSDLDKYAASTSAHEAWGKGYNVPGAAVVIGTYHTGETGSYLFHAETDVTLRNVTLRSKNNVYVCMHSDEEAAGAELKTLTFDALTALKTLGKDNRDGELVTQCTEDTSLVEIWDERAPAA